MDARLPPMLSTQLEKPTSPPRPPKRNRESNSDTNKLKTRWQNVIRLEMGLPSHNYVKEALDALAKKLGYPASKNNQLTIPAIFAIARENKISLPTREALKRIDLEEHRIKELEPHEYFCPSEVDIEKAKLARSVTEVSGRNAPKKKPRIVRNVKVNKEPHIKQDAPIESVPVRAAACHAHQPTRRSHGSWASSARRASPRRRRWRIGRSTHACACTSTRRSRASRRRRRRRRCRPSCC